MQDEVVSLKVDPSLVTSILEKRIQAAIVEQLGDDGKLIEQAVRLALSTKVDKKGNSTSRYDSDLRYDFLEVLTTNAIQEAAKEALTDWLAQNSKLIKKAVLKELDSPERQRSIAKAYADAIENSLIASWTMSCNIDFNKRPE